MSDFSNKKNFFQNNAPNREARLASLAQTELSSIILNKSLKELKQLQLPAIFSITEVSIPKGHHHFKIYISVYNSQDSQATPTDILLKELNKHSNVIRGELCRRMKLRIAPTLHFCLDDTVSSSIKINTILDNLDD